MGLSSSKQQATATATATATTKPPNIDMDDTTNFFIIVILKLFTAQRYFVHYEGIMKIQEHRVISSNY